VYSLGAYPFGKLADRASRAALLGGGLAVLVAADLLLAMSDQGPAMWGGIALWGLHMAMTQGLLATLIADTAPADLRGTAFGLFNLVSGLALLVASGLAGWLWDRWGAPAAFVSGAAFAAAALAALLIGGLPVRRAPAAS
jgi:MFS family permease